MKKFTSVGERIKSTRKAKKISAEELARKINVSVSTLYRYEKGDIEKVSTEVLKQIAIALNTEPAYFMGWSDTPTPVQTQTLQEIIVTSKQLEQPRQEKVLNFANEQLEEQNKVVSMFDKKLEEEDYINDYVEGLVAAGNGTFQEDNLHMEVRLRASDVPEEYDTIAKVAGDSMEPLIQDNDLLFINITSQVDINDIGIFQINGKNFVKKLKRDYGGAWYLQSLNNNYEEIYLSEDDNIRTIGEVVDIYRED